MGVSKNPPTRDRPFRTTTDTEGEGTAIECAGAQSFQCQGERSPKKKEKPDQAWILCFRVDLPTFRTEPLRDHGTLA